jgi:hypothetical protein
MKTFLKMIGAILGCLVLLLVVLRITGFGPRARTPGLWLSGTLVTTPVGDWSFADKYPTLEIQTRTWYLLPHSVTTNCVSYNGQLYVDSIYRAGLRYPNGRSWNENVARDPHVRIKIGNRLYDCVLTHVTDPTVIAAVLQAKSKKYPQLKVPTNGTVQIFHVVSNGAPVTATSD